MNEVKARLLASKEQYENALHEDGKEKGRLWASDEAEYVELDRLSVELDKSIVSHYDPFRSFDEICEIATCGEGDADDMFYFVDRDKRHTYNHPAFCAGFVEGAVEVYKMAMAA